MDEADRNEVIQSAEVAPSKWRPAYYSAERAFI
jgi:hypothetical protein